MRTEVATPTLATLNQEQAKSAKKESNREMEASGVVGLGEIYINQASNSLSASVTVPLAHDIVEEVSMGVEIAHAESAFAVAPPSSSEEHVLNSRVHFLPDDVDEFDSVDIVLK